MADEIGEVEQLLNSLNSYLGPYGIHLPTWVFILIIIVILLGAIIYSLDIIISRLWRVIIYFKSFFYNIETKDFIEVRNSFVGHLEHEVEKLNRESDWDDSLHYTELEAEVEVRHYIELDPFQSRNPIIWLKNLMCLINNLKGIKSLDRIEKNLTEAITRSKSQAFIIIGDPGSGKTVSLRHVFLEMSKKAKNSKSKDVTVPIYLNLKQLNITPDKISADEIHNWIVDQLRTNKDRTVREFVEKNFDKMLKKGQLFFLFDSFDEIPSVMDAQEENEIIAKYSEAIDSFLHSESKRKGLVTSRPYRSPRKLDAQKMTILPLKNERIRKSLKKYLRQESSLSDQIWDNLLYREDLLHVVRNPFYLALLAQYCKNNKTLPERHFDLFEQFVQNRSKTDENLLSHLGFTPDELIQHAEILAFAMTKTPSIGLEANINQIRKITSGFDKSACWDSNKIEALVSALTYSKIGRKSDEIDRPISFSFVHRRFHEYFCARYLKREYQSAPFEQFNSDNRWREILVLLCEVLPTNLLGEVFELSLTGLKEGNSASLGSPEHRKALEAILFLKDAFKSRIPDVPNNIRLECSNFIKRQFQDNNLLNQKRALEALILADKDSVADIIELAFKQDSRYLNETAFRSCRILERIPENIIVTIQKILFDKYTKLEIYKQYSNYSILFSSSSALKQLNVFLQTLLVSTLIQFLLILAVFIYYVYIDPKNFVIFTYGVIIYLIFYPFIWTALKSSSKESLTSIFGSPCVCFSLYMIFFFMYFHIFNDVNLLLFVPFIMTMILVLLTTSATIKDFLEEFVVMIFGGMIFFAISSYNSYIAKLLLYLPFLIIVLKAIYDYIKNYLFKIAFNLFMDLKKRQKIDLVNFAKLIINLLFCLGIIVLTLTLMIMLQNRNYVISLNYTMFNYIYDALSYNFGYTLATIVLITDIIFILVVCIAIAAAVLVLVGDFIYSNVKDQLVLYRLSHEIRKSSKMNSYNISTTEALSKLGLLRTEVAKAKYIQILIDSLYIDKKDIQFIEEQANKNKGDVRDLLFQLAEVWQNSIDKKL